MEIDDSTQLNETINPETCEDKNDISASGERGSNNSDLSSTSEKSLNKGNSFLTDYININIILK